MKQHHSVNLILLIFLLIVFGCSGGDDGSGLDDAGGKVTGTLSLSLTDAPAGDLKAVYITIEEVRVCSEATEENNDVNLEKMEEGCIREVITRPGEIYNLLELVNGVTETLGVTELPAGTYHQMRLMIGAEPGNDTEAVKGFNIFGEEHPYANYIIDTDGRAHSLKIPSGVQSGVKLVHDFEINENKYTELILDFDAHRSIVKAGKKDKYILKPTIKVIDTKHMAKLTGTVTDTSQFPIESVAVSAQRTEDPSGLIVVEASTTTDAEGNYQLFLEKDKDYTIISFSTGRTPQCATIYKISDDYSQSFSLDTVEEGIVRLTVSGAKTESYINLSFRKTDQDCGNGDQEIEILGKTIAYDEDADGFTYSTVLPVGKGYKVVYSDGVNESFATFEVTADAETLLENLTF